MLRAAEGSVVHLLTGLALGVVAPAGDAHHLAADGAGGFAGRPVGCTCHRVGKGADAAAGLLGIGEAGKGDVAATALDFHRLPRQILRQQTLTHQGRIHGIVEGIVVAEDVGDAVVVHGAPQCDLLPVSPYGVTVSPLQVVEHRHLKGGQAVIFTVLVDGAAVIPAP